MTLRQFHDSKRWYFKEKGLEHIWNEYNQIFNSQLGSGPTPGTTVISTISLIAGTGVQVDTASTFSGIWATGGEHGATAFDKPPADPGGNIGPHPRRNSERLPTAGFRTAA